MADDWQSKTAKQLRGECAICWGTGRFNLYSYRNEKEEFVITNEAGYCQCQLGQTLRAQKEAGQDQDEKEN